MAKKKIIQVTECFAYGTAKSLKQLCELLKDEYEITVCYCRRDDSDNEIKHADSDIKWIEMYSDGRFRHLKNILMVRRLIKSSTFALHGHSSFAGLYVRIAAIGKHVPLVLYSPRGYAFLRQDLNIFSRFIFLMAEILLSFLGRTVTCGKSEFNIGKRFSRHICNINNSVMIKEQPAQRSDDQFRVISVGRICYQKGFDIFIQIAKALKDKEFVWVGSPDPQYMDAVMKQHPSLPDNIKIIAYSEQGELFSRMTHSSVVLHPSRWEGLSRVLIESLSLGLPIVTSTCKQNLDCLLPQAEGEYSNGFSCENISDYVVAIDKLQHDPELLANMKNSSLNLAKSDFDINVVKTQWLSLYRGEY
ncbi:glycosyltransferase [Vibrio sp. ABG19]|uniref:glycosyltransferase n=1 Tax=Vibrio sp. ABG19 TaxID=2817385 RepID=UPI00249E4B58|nr:glycosyltransferase [Vibrio sp. ABG19]WGY46806.1 glycosyltransferase [Vibrio sp. ABG19]